MNINNTDKKKKRYVLIGGKKEDAERAILEYLGVLGFARAEPRIEEKNEKVILEVNRKEIVDVLAALELSQKKLKIEKVSGTLKGLI